MPTLSIIADNGSNIDEAARRLGIARAVACYVKALARWASAGFPARNPKAVADIIAEHCQRCPRHTNGRCGACGCQVDAEKWAVRNKAKMATEHCPDGKW